VLAQHDSFELQRVVVVDNNSHDHSLDGVDDLSLPMTVIRNPANRGFAAACNQGARGSSSTYLLFLNPDTRLFSNSLSVPIHCMEQPEFAHIGICGIQLLDENNRVSRTCARFPTLQMFLSKIFGLDYVAPRLFHTHFMKEWDHSHNLIVDHVIGAFFFIRQSLFTGLHGFDERFFVYLEDLDISLRANLQGWSTFYLADAQAFHKGHGSSEQVKATRLFYSLQSRLLYGYKHFDTVSATLLALATLSVEPFTRSIFALRESSNIQVLLQTIEGYSMLWRWLVWLLFMQQTKKVKKTEEK
jgi:hypothetical protein